ncbi:OmpW family protein [Cobetia marina]|jgi:outer membrane protein|nr:OmpW family protein [Cobetia marina]GED43045.1 outer membrane protein W [Cobetia marina]
MAAITAALTLTATSAVAAPFSSTDSGLENLDYGAGQFWTRAGVAKVSPKSDNGRIDAIGADVDVDDDSAFAFTLGYRFTDTLGIELLAAQNFEHDISLNGQKAGSVDHLPPTLTLQYYPLGGRDSRIQPYIGAGVNYTHFSDETLDDGTKLEMDDSWGAAAQIGVDLVINEHWAANVAAWYLDIDSDVTVAGSVNDKVEIDPIVTMAGISYRF